MRLREIVDDALGDKRLAVRGLARGRMQGIRGSRCRGNDDDAVPAGVADDARHAFERGGRGHGGPAELEHRACQRMALAIAITSPSMAEAVASPPAPGPLKTRRPARSVSMVTTFVGPSAAPSSELAGTSSGPTRAFVARSPKSAVAR